MQSHTFTRARGVPIRCINAPINRYTNHDQEPSTSQAPQRSVSLASNRFRHNDVTDSSLPPTYVVRFHDEAAARRMQYRRLGQTDMIVSKISFGSAPIGGMFGNVDDSITQIVETALRSGINLIDTAYWYGHSRSESILGKVLSKVPRKAYYISTKIHDTDFEPQKNIILYETLPALEMARQSGRIRYIGLTGYELRKLASVIDCSTIKIDAVLTYCHGSMNDNSLSNFTYLLKKKGIGILNGSPLSMGLLTERGPPPWHPAADFIKETCLAAAHYCMSKNISISKLALAYAFEIEGTASCVVGMDSIQQVRDNIALAIADSPLTDVEQRVLDRIMRRYFDRLENAGWSGIDVGAYWKRLKKLGLTALATHRHSSVESLASTLNGLSLHSSPSSSELRTPRRSRNL
ncbi:oxidoreductase, aldo/keto reductase family protein [Dictyocaulus viviparus]|uniref:Oxidoreductase, aldo/keto reductase family protein n=1 Tax=Dictyocaulus viviparus TaxID=29172 RepID=A0A0D8XTH8_DICVI|nr:oxidoreductase, aldo/keto reductase family protein [Dictyocaulus viviparus]